MRNLKRVLSLALAIVMVIGMMVIGAGAASFDDDKDITKAEAAAVMAELKVMEGDENGDFNPTDILTREQAAAMLARVVLGEKGAKTVSENKVGVFTDVAADRWSAGYIAWAANQNYIAGNGDGTFNPAGQLTGVAYAKLLLVALGFDPAVEGYVNNTNWATNIGADAVAFGLTKNVDSLLSEPLTRENAAQMTLNALEATCVEYESKGIEIITADGTVIRTGVLGPYAQSWDSRWDTIKVDDDYNAFDKTEDNTIQLIEKLFPGVEKKAGKADKWGNPAEFAWYNNSKKAFYTEMATPVVEYFTAVDECDVVKDLGEKKDTEYAQYWVDGVDQGDGEWDATGKGYHETGTGVWTRIYEVDEEYIAVAVNTYFAQVTKVVTEKTDKNGHVTRDAGVELDVYFEDETAEEFFFATDDEFSKKDYVIVNICWNADEEEYEVAEAALAESVTETVKRITNEDAPVLDTVKTKEGGEYGENVKFFYIYDEAKEDTVNKLQTKQEYDLYFDAYGNIIAAIITKDSSTTINGIINKIVWKDSDNYDTDGYASANIVKMDAEDEDVDLVYSYVADTELYDAGSGKKNPGTYADGSVNSSKQWNEGWYDILSEYEQNKDGAWEITKQAAAVELTKVAPKVDGTIFSIMDEEDHTADNKTVFLIKSKDGKNDVYTSYTGYKTIPSMKAAEGETIPVQYFVGKTGRLTMVFVDGTDAIWTGSSELVYLLDDEITDEDDQLLEFKAFVGTDKTTFVLSEDMAEDLGVEDEGDVMDITAGLYELSFNSDDQVIEISELKGIFLTDVEISNGVVSELEVIDEDFDIDEVPFYSVGKAKVAEGDADEADEAEWVQYAVDSKDNIVGVWYAEIED